ncbi:hypothetical protein [Ramlibacter humi]|uniref:NHL repeat containing protein n=1 Tax=Ramlibacter humi TaxID=2530451 RepID=A0A4Z0BW65_9BURK|nr:hypothetical protein [Ramlibacter humi]TFZ03567.1 hypothetical protein EZ216_07800 [Ramlibacter humi]
MEDQAAHESVRPPSCPEASMTSPSRIPSCRPRGTHLHLAVTLLSAAMIASCGGGSGGGGSAGGSDSAQQTLSSATFSKAPPALARTDTVVIRFDAPADTASLVLGGGLSAEATGTWSSTSAENDTYTLSPASGNWTVGEGKDITVSVKGKAGGSASAAASYVVPLAIANFAPAVAAIGQANLTSRIPNSGTIGSVVAGGMNTPYGNVAIAPDGKVFISDYNNNRVLGFNSLPTASGANADIVLGQPDFVTGTYPGAPTRSVIGSPQGAAIGAGKMAVVDYAYSRVLIYNAVPTASGALPDVVVGASGFTTSAPGCGAAKLNLPYAVFITQDGRLLVADSGNNRVLIWNSVPTTNGASPDLVLGQGSLTTCARNDDDQNAAPDVQPSARTFDDPQGIWTDGTRLAIIDRQNNRVLIWKTFPTSNFQPADIVLGHSSFNLNQPNDGNPLPSAQTLDHPSAGIHSNGVQFAVADDSNNRVLIWNTFPTRNFQPADVVLGQGAFDMATKNDDNQDRTNDLAATARTMSTPIGVRFYKDKLLVTDLDNNRVLVIPSR